jgi:FKBP-type peptidyl-prolyl cis-trans isomerase FkpA
LSRKGILTAAFALFALFALVAGCSDSTSSNSDSPPSGSDPATTTFASSLGVNISAMTKLSSSLYIQDLVTGTGGTAASGHDLLVTYTGWLANGTQFDSNVGKAPFPFVLGAGAVIPGWDQGLVGMRLGGTRRLVIGSALGYGTAGRQPSIPSNATLVFTVQLDSLQ